MLNQHNAANINSNYILLDSESTDHIFCNDKFLTDIAQTTDGESLRLHTSGGLLDTHQKGKFGGFTVWFNPNCLANILSLAQVSDTYRVTMDTFAENAFLVHISEGNVMKFIRIQPGLYLYDASNVDITKLSNKFSFLQTVTSNKLMFSQRDIRKAEDAIALNSRTNHQAAGTFSRVVQTSLIRNNPLTLGDVNTANAIYGPPIPPIKGRSRYQTSARIQDTSVVTLPQELLERLKNETLCVDYCFLEGMCIFTTVARRIKYKTATYPHGRSKTLMVKEIKDACQIYHARGIRIVTINADNEFKKAENDIRPIRLICCGTDEHIPEIERSIQTIKNNTRAARFALPFLAVPRVILREMVDSAVAFSNAFGDKNMKEGRLTPRNIIDNLPHIDYHDLKYEMGQYVQLHTTEKVTNTLKSRTIGAIVLGPRNIQGRYNYMSLETGHKIDGRVVSEHPLTDDVIKCVEEFAKIQGQPYNLSKMLKYEWRKGVEIEDSGSDNQLDATPFVESGIIPPPVLPINENDDGVVGATNHQGAEITQGRGDDDLVITTTQGAQRRNQENQQIKECLFWTKIKERRLMNRLMKSSIDKTRS